MKFLAGIVIDGIVGFAVGYVAAFEKIGNKRNTQIDSVE